MYAHHLNRHCLTAMLVTALLAGTSGTCRAVDVIEFLSGAKSRGQVHEIRKKERSVVFDVSISGKSLRRVYPYDKIHAVTMKGKRYVLNEIGEAAASGTVRGRAEVETLIDTLGRTPPDWFESTPLEYPATLDLTWPLQPPKSGWDNQRNVGQYVWDIINPNPNRWKSGIRLLHHLLSQHQQDRKLAVRDMSSLAGMYFRFFQDYARAAFWWRQAGVSAGEANSIALAECYWRLGSRPMATELLESRLLRSSMVKLWSDMGETDKALALADRMAPLLAAKGASASDVYLHAGDACRNSGDYTRAIGYYQKVLDEPQGLRGRVELNRQRAQANLDAIRRYELFDLSRVPDGIYSDSSIGFSGQIHVQVTVEAGKIQKVEVTKHEERQFYSALTDVPAQILAKQSVKGVDATSGATVTAEAIVNATAKALLPADEQTR